MSIFSLKLSKRRGAFLYCRSLERIAERKASLDKASTVKEPYRKRFRKFLDLSAGSNGMGAGFQNSFMQSKVKKYLTKQYHRAYYLPERAGDEPISFSANYTSSHDANFDRDRALLRVHMRYIKHHVQAIFTQFPLLAKHYLPLLIKKKDFDDFLHNLHQTYLCHVLATATERCLADFRFWSWGDTESSSLEMPLPLAYLGTELSKSAAGAARATAACSGGSSANVLFTRVDLAKIGWHPALGQTAADHFSSARAASLSTCFITSDLMWYFVLARQEVFKRIFSDYLAARTLFILTASFPELLFLPAFKPSLIVTAPAEPLGTYGYRLLFVRQSVLRSARKPTHSLEQSPLQAPFSEKNPSQNSLAKRSSQQGTPPTQQAKAAISSQLPLSPFSLGEYFIQYFLKNHYQAPQLAGFAPQDRASWHYPSLMLYKEAFSYYRQKANVIMPLKSYFFKKLAALKQACPNIKVVYLDMATSTLAARVTDKNPSAKPASFTSSRSDLQSAAFDIGKGTVSAVSSGSCGRLVAQITVDNVLATNISRALSPPSGTNGISSTRSVSGHLCHIMQLQPQLWRYFTEHGSFLCSPADVVHLNLASEAKHMSTLTATAAERYVHRLAFQHKTASTALTFTLNLPFITPIAHLRKPLDEFCQFICSLQAASPQ